MPKIIQSSQKRFLPWHCFQNGDSGSYLASLAAQLSQEMGTSYHSVLQQLEDLRLAEWSDQAPPPPSHPGHRPTHTTTNNSTHTYANYPSREEERRPKASSSQQTYNDSDPIYQPGQYAVTSTIIKILLPPPASFSYLTLIPLSNL